MTSSEEKFDSLYTTVQTLQKDMAQVGNLVDRLDVTIEKLTEVSTTVSQLLAVQGSRLEFQEKVVAKLEELIEKRRQETSSEIKDVYTRIEKIEKDLQDDMDENHKNIIDEIKKLRMEGNEQHKAMSERMGRFEKWMYMAFGVITILTFLLDKINLSAIFS